LMTQKALLWKKVLMIFSIAADDGLSAYLQDLDFDAFFRV